MKVSCAFVVIFVSLGLADSFSSTASKSTPSCRRCILHPPSHDTTHPFPSSFLLEATTSTNDISVSRNKFLSWTAGAAVAFATASPALAKEIDPALKGTKKDPVYEACVSTCMYDCTKPKGMEQKSRQECLPECKSKCATSKEQLMIGTPLKN